MTSTRPRTGAPATVATPLDRANLRRRVDAALANHLDQQVAGLQLVSDDITPVADTIAGLVLGGGKRLRPAFAYWGWRGSRGDPSHDQPVVNAVSCLELLHACALVHDDVMDGSDLRRGAPSVHRALAGLHRRSDWCGSADSFGLAGAILVGDLCLVWADSMLHGAGLPVDALLRGLGTYDQMRSELMAGQYLDVLEQAIGDRSGADAADRAMRIARYKTAKYTVERPLHLGAALADADPAVIASYSAYGLPLGEAFQLCDDLLGVFGDPAVTGKPAGDDLREGKRTLLVAATARRATSTQSAVLRQYLGDPDLGADGVSILRAVIEETGARAEVERLIAQRTEAALDALTEAPLDLEAREVLADLAVVATGRW